MRAEASVARVWNPIDRFHLESFMAVCVTWKEIWRRQSRLIDSPEITDET